MPDKRRASRAFAWTFGCIAAFGASPIPAAASVDPLLVFLTNPAVAFRAGTGGSIAVDVLTRIEGTVPDGEPAVPEIVFDPGAITVSYRRIDQTLRPWVQLHSSAPPHGAMAGESSSTRHYPFGAIPAVLGATYEIRVGVADAISWKPGAPTPPPSEFGEVVDRMRMAACFDPGTPESLAALARETIKIVTIPSARIASPDVELKAAKLAFIGHSARVVRSGAGALLDFSSPHACDSTVPLTIGQRVRVIGIERYGGDDLGTTSVGPSGVPASAGLPAHVERSAPNAVVVLLASSDKLQADSISLTFASTDELRQYLKPL